MAIPSREQLLSLIEATAAQHGWRIDGDSLVVPTTPGRNQKVAVTLTERDGGEFVRLLSRIGEANILNETRQLSALRLNANQPIGAMAIDGDDVVVTDSVPLRYMVAGLLGELVAGIAARADQFEKALFGTDEQ